MNRGIWLILLAGVSTADAVVIRDDVPDLRYRMAESEFPALADMPGEGHGVLIHPRWVVTAAHAVTWQDRVDVIVVGGTPRAVERVIVHPGYRKLPQTLIDAMLESDDSGEVTEFLAASDDIALLRLAEPVCDVEPARIHASPTPGKEIRIIGRGATGKGSDGHHPHGPNRTDLRQGFNQIDSAEGRWIGYTFDPPPAALSLEAGAGNGDSGGPILIAVRGKWEVAGITSWKGVEGSVAEFRPGRYGQVNYGVRLAHYEEWIRQTISEGGAAEAPR